MTASTPHHTDPTSSTPRPLLVAASLAAVEAVVLIGYGLYLLAVLDGTRVTMGLTSVVFFVLYGGGLAFCAWRLLRLQSWARAPVVLTQLIQVMVGVSFWGGATTPVAVATMAVGLVTLAGVFHPSSLAALEADR